MPRLRPSGGRPPSFGKAMTDRQRQQRRRMRYAIGNFRDRMRHEPAELMGHWLAMHAFNWKRPGIFHVGMRSIAMHGNFWPSSSRTSLRPEPPQI
jgi:hypothetical protein